MYLGIFGPGPNSSACFIENGEILFWAEEERFTRIKTSPHSFPYLSIQKGLDYLKANINDIKAIGYGWDCVNYKEEATENLLSTNLSFPSESDELNKLSQDKLNLAYNPILIKRNIELLFNKENFSKIPKIYFLPHHLCHAASTISILEDQSHAAIITNDGVGGIISSAIFEYKDGIINEPISKVILPNSLGALYASITEYLGYRPYEDEGRVMGLSCYGKHDDFLEEAFAQILTIVEPENGFYKTDPTYRYNFKRSKGNRFSDKLIKLLGEPRKPEESPMKERYRNIAFALQASLEKALISMTSWTKEVTNADTCLFAGGVHMNCKANGYILRGNLFKNCYFQPAASDNGVCLGAALIAEKEYTKTKIIQSRMQSLYQGTSYDDDEILKILEKCKVNYKKSSDIAKYAAKSISENKLIAWFQGRMEVGARSLGSRSILANPISSQIRDKVNINIKNRESWRPFCPSIKEEAFSKYFLNSDYKSNPEYMIIAYDVDNKYSSLIPSCVHVDNTARPQSVSFSVNPLYWNLLDHLEKYQSHPIVLNTSFNVKGEPIVENPEQALRCFYGTGLDELCIGSYVVYK